MKLCLIDGSRVDTLTLGLTTMIGGPSGSSSFKRKIAGVPLYDGFA